MLQYFSVHGYGTYKDSKKRLYLQEGYFKNSELNSILCANCVSSDGGLFSKFCLILWLRAAWPGGRFPATLNFSATVRSFIGQSTFLSKGQ